MDPKEETPFLGEEEARNKPKWTGCLPEKTNIKCRVRSKPNVEGQEYLNLYLMVKERERLEKLGQVTEKMHTRTARNLSEVEERIAKAEKTVSPGEREKVEAKGKVEKTRKRAPKKPMKTIALNY